MNEKALKDIITFLELGAWASRKTIKKINEMGGNADYWTGAAEALEETTEMINHIVKKNEK